MRRLRRLRRIHRMVTFCYSFSGFLLRAHLAVQVWVTSGRSMTQAQAT